jgi:ribosome-associated translation inhibitor RaiA
MVRARDNRRVSLPKRVSKSAKRTAGPTSAAVTPLSIRTAGVHLDEATRQWVRSRLGRQLGKFALQIERVTVRMRDLNGPRGGVDHVCVIKVVLSGLPSVVAEQRGKQAREAFDRAAAVVERAVRKTLGRAATLGVRKPAKPAAGRPAKRRGDFEPSSVPTLEAGSVIGRRVGRARANLLAAADRPEKRRRDQPVDTAQPGVSATDRKAGYGSTARRNTRLSDAKATAALEDSAQDRPSRKSTRKSANRGKRDVALRLREVAEARSPVARSRKPR